MTDYVLVTSTTVGGALVAKVLHACQLLLPLFQVACITRVIGSFYWWNSVEVVAS